VGRKDKNKNKNKNRTRVTRNPNIDNYSKKLCYHAQQMLIAYETIKPREQPTSN